MYNTAIAQFKSASFGEIYSEIDHSVDNSRRSGMQKMAWDVEIPYLQNELQTQDGQILFEYTIPRIGKRLDVVVLLNNIIFILEFKVGEDDSKAARKQTKQYAQALRWYHSASRNHLIVPIPVTTYGRKRTPVPKYIEKDNMYEVIRCNRDNLWKVMSEILAMHPGEDCVDWNQSWALGKYNPTPTIIEATCYRYINNNIKEIRESEADANQLTTTTQYLIDNIKTTQERGEKAIFFVTGVPGAGKTLIGLDLAAETQRQYQSIFLSGNGPLVDVLTEALTADSKCFNSLNDGIDELQPDSMIQLIHRYRKNAVNKVKGIVDGKLIIDGDPNEEAEVEHVVIFDEAQRAWNREKLTSPERSGRTTLLQHPDFPYSEPAFLLWSLNLRKDWVAVVCLVGGGQEINTGEAGIVEWIKAIHTHFPDWHVYISPNLKGPEYGGEELKQELTKIRAKTESNHLHLSTSRRSLRADKVSDFVQHLLNGETEKASSLYKEFKERFPIKITRSIDTAKKWLRDRKAESRKNETSGKIGILISSKAYRLRPLGFDIKKVGEYKNVGKWFLKETEDVESSDYLEVALSEFFVQGLELDWTGVIWDADFRDVDGNQWAYYTGFSGNKWTGQKIAAKTETDLTESQQYQKNAYRVLLTRARRGMVIVVPEGDSADPTRPASNYDPTFHYLKSLGLEQI